MVLNTDRSYYQTALLGPNGQNGQDAMGAVKKPAAKLEVEHAIMRTFRSALHVKALKPKHNPVKVSVANGKH